MCLFLPTFKNEQKRIFFPLETIFKSQGVLLHAFSANSVAVWVSRSPLSITGSGIKASTVWKQHSQAAESRTLLWSGGWSGIFWDTCVWRCYCVIIGLGGSVPFEKEDLKQKSPIVSWRRVHANVLMKWTSFKKQPRRKSWFS